MAVPDRGTGKVRSDGELPSAGRVSALEYRRATLADVPALAAIRAAEWETQAYWEDRIRGYMLGEKNPQKALPQRVVIVAARADGVAGFIAGHLTRRFDCDSELQWIDVVDGARRQGIATELLRKLARWFVEQGARRVCVDVDPANAAGRAFYGRHGAVAMNTHWLAWDDITTVASEKR
jgi:ribosomal protein S18 acetylase RimI-like enzyme